MNILKILGFVFLFLFSMNIVYSNPDYFISVWNTSQPGVSGNNQIQLPLDCGGSYNFVAYWGDGTSSTITSCTDPNRIHTYATAGVYEVNLSGQIEGFGFRIDNTFPYDNQYDSRKLLEIKQWGTLKIHNLGEQFAQAENMDVVAIDAINLTGITNLDYMFSRASSFNGDISIWDVSNVTSMKGMFSDTTSFNQDISVWNVSSVSDMSYMFSDASSFNQDLSSWDVSNVLNMAYMFSDASFFNQNLNGWDVSSVTDMKGMFYGSSFFNGDISSWDVSSVIDMSYMFSDASSFNRNVGVWNVSSVTNMYRMFYGASSFNQPLNNWDVSSVTDMEEMFYYAASFNQPLDNWDVSSVTDMRGMFNFASSFNQPLDNWDVSSVTDMSYMFGDATSFNQNLNNWNVANVINMRNMFNDAFSFNGDISSWDVGSVNNMDMMFYGTSSFNSDISTWNVGSVTDMKYMFRDASSFNHPLNSWNVGNVVDMRNMFDGASSFNGDISTWNVGSVTDMRYMFRDASSFNHPLNSWNVGNVNNMRGMFYGASSFNGDISTWTVSNVNDMEDMFREASSFNQNLNGWDVSSVNDMNSMFRDASSFNGDISTWNVGSVTDMGYMFNGASSFNQNLNGWDVGGVTNMNSIFYDASSFNGDISTWNVSGITDMSYMFNGASSFNQNLNGWDVSSVNDMSYMFSGASSFNQNLNGWDVSSVNDMSHMFSGASSFNGDITSWSVNGVDYMDGMFYNANFFNQNLSTWIISSVYNMTNMFKSSALSDSYYTDILVSWASLPSVRLNVRLDADAQYYPIAQTYKNILTSMPRNWTISDGGQIMNNSKYFISEWNTSLPGTSNNNQIQLPLDCSGSFNFVAFWGDGTNSTITSCTDPDRIHTYSTPGVYEIILDGNIDGFGFYDISTDSDIDDGDKLLEIKQWGNLRIHNRGYQFAHVSNLIISATDAPNLTGISNMAYMFYYDYNFNSDISDWNVSDVTDMSYMFYYNSYFNQPLNTWDVSSVTDMSYMFYQAGYFNQPLSNWDVSSVTDMSYMFGYTDYFNRHLNNWNTSSVINMRGMFYYSYNFNGDINNWDTSSVTDISYMFYEADDFNRPLNNWDTSSVTNTRYMFYYATSFNQNLNNWDVSNVLSMEYMFNRAYAFNGDISSWDVSSVTDMDYMFYYISNFNQDLSNWNVSSVNYMRGMFSEANIFNSDLSSWDVSSVIDMEYMFYDANAFNSDLSSWDVSSVNNIEYMFYSAGNFNSDLSSWDVSGITDMSYVFYSASSFDSDLSSWDVSNVIDMSYIFTYSGLSDQHYTDLLIGWSNLPSLRNNVNLDATARFCLYAEEYRNKLIHGPDYWDIDDSGPKPCRFSPDIQCVFNHTGASPVSCNNFTYKQEIEQILIDCNATIGVETNVTINLTNREDNTQYYTNTITTKIGDYFVAYPNQYLNDSGSYNISYRCRDDSIYSSAFEFRDYIPFGILNQTLITPITNISVNNGSTFTFTARLDCVGGECGNISFLLDPILNSKFFYEDFESGNINRNYWNYSSSTNFGRVDLLSCTSMDSYALSMDSTSYNANMIKTKINFTGRKNIILDFYLSDRNDESHVCGDHAGDLCNGDGVFFTCNGNYWYEVAPLTGFGSTFTNLRYNISNHLNFCGSLDSDFAIKFTQYDDMQCNGDGLHFDNITISWLGKGVVPMNRGSPFYTTSQNPLTPATNSCFANMIDGDGCEISWTVHVNGSDNYRFFTVGRSLNYHYRYTSRDIWINITDNPEIFFPELLCEFNHTGANPVSCDNFSYKEELENIFINCNTTMGNDLNVSINLTNFEDSREIYNGVITSKIGDYFVANVNEYLNNSGNYTLTYICSNDFGSQDSFIEGFYIPFGNLSASLISPITNTSVINTTSFNFTSQVECIGGECGNVNFTLDPIVVGNADIYYTFQEVSGGNYNIYGCSNNPTSGVDDGFWTYQLGFDFPFFNKTILSTDNVYFDTNGRLSFTDSSSDLSPSSADMESDEIIAFLWRDLGGGSYNNEYFCGNQGTAPNRYAVFRVDSEWYNGGGATQAEIILHESGKIVINYGTVIPRSGFYYGISLGNGTAIYNISDSSSYTGKTFEYVLSSGNKNGVVPMNRGNPFYTITQNPMTFINDSCLGSMESNDICNITWTVYANGTGIHKFFTIATPVSYQFILENISESVWINITPYPEIFYPKLQCQFNHTGASPTSCDNFLYNEELENILINCNSSLGVDDNVSIVLKNVQDSRVIYNNTITSKTGDYFVANINEYLNNSGNYTIDYTCSDNLGNVRYFDENYFIPFGEFWPFLVNPVVNMSVSNKSSFSFVSRIRCYTGECGDFNFTLDPIGFPKSCNEIKLSNPSVSSGVYDIDPEGDGTTVEVYCEMDIEGGGWTLIANLGPNNCAENLNFINNNLTTLSTYGMARNLGNMNHTKWLLRHYDSGSLTHTIVFNYTTIEPLDQRFYDLDANSEVVNWKAYDDLGTINYGQVTNYIISNSMGFTSPASWWSRTTVSGDDGIWGVADVATLDGNTPGPYLNSVVNPRYGFENPNGVDSSCNTYYDGFSSFSSTNWVANLYVKDNLTKIGKGVIPMNSGNPFYTTTQNPMTPINSSCLGSMGAGDYCDVAWTVHVNGTGTHKFFTIATPLSNITNYTQKDSITSVWINITEEGAGSLSYFVSEWNTSLPGVTANNQIELPLDCDGFYSFVAVWGDGTNSTITSCNDPNRIHNYSVPGVYEVNLTGAIDGFGFNDTWGDSDTDDGDKLIKIKQWGNLRIHNKGWQFANADNLNIVATDSPILTGINNLEYMFYNSLGFNGDLNDWDVSDVTNMRWMFGFASSFDNDLHNWDVSSVTDTSYMFYRAYAFDGNISSWDVSSVNDMRSMFSNADSFNGDLNSWDVSSVSNMNYMFAFSNSFNRDLHNWDVSSVIDMSYMFYNTDFFNGNISSWDISNVLNMEAMFYDATSFNQNLSLWSVSGITDMSSLFRGARAFNGDISSWDVSSVTDMNYMFTDASSFNSDISSWDVSSVNDMSHMFRGASSFNGDISGWDVSSVIDMSYMFSGASSFNRDISVWDVSSVTDMDWTFSNVDLFNYNLSSWDVSSVTDMNHMFYNANSFNQPLDNWDITSVTDMTNMLIGNSLSVQNYTDTLIGWASIAPVQNNVRLDVGTGYYVPAINPRNNTLIGIYNWIINDAGLILMYDISSCSNIIAPGLYTMTSSIIDSNVDQCINIETSNVTIDCNDFIIDGDGTASDGISVIGSLGNEYTNITLYNCLLSDWSSSNVYFEYVDNSNILSSNSSNSLGNGISFVNSDYNIINNTIFSNNSNEGLSVSSSNSNNFSNLILYNNTGDGFYMLDSTNNYLNNFNSVNNIGNGIVFLNSDSNTINGGNISENSQGVILSSDSDSNVINNISSDFNSQFGININTNSNSNNVSYSDLTNNGASGVNIQSNGDSNSFYFNNLIDNSIYDIFFGNSGVDAPIDNIFIGNYITNSSSINATDWSFADNFFNGTYLGENIGNWWTNFSCLGSENRSGYFVCTTPSNQSINSINGIYDFAPLWNGSITFDPTPPVTSINDTISSWRNTNVSLELSCTDVFTSCDTTLYCIDTINSCSPTLVYGGSEINITTEGISYIRFFSNDTKGNIELVNSYNYSIDYTNPTVTIVSPQPIGYFNLYPDLNFSYGDSLSGVSSCLYSLNDSSNITITGCNNDSSVTVGSDGEYNLTLYVIDNVGNVGSDIVTWNYTAYIINHEYLVPTPRNDSHYSGSNFTINIKLNQSTYTPLVNVYSNSSISVYGMTNNGDDTYTVVIPMNSSNNIEQYYFNVSYDSGNEVMGGVYFMSYPNYSNDVFPAFGGIFSLLMLLLLLIGGLYFRNGRQ